MALKNSSLSDARRRRSNAACKVKFAELVGHGFRRVIFFKHRQFVDDDVEARLGLYMRGVAHHFELNAVRAFRTARKDLAGKQRNFMRKPVAFMHYAVDAALGHSLVGTEFLFHGQSLSRPTYTNQKVRCQNQEESCI